MNLKKRHLDRTRFMMQFSSVLNAFSEIVDIVVPADLRSFQKIADRD